MRSRDWMLAIGAMAIVALVLQMQERIAAQSPTGIVISEIRFHGTGAAPANDEFIELFNTSATARNISGWMIRSSNNNTPPTLLTRLTIANVVLQPGCFFLAVNSLGYSGTIAGDQAYSVGFGDNGGVALTDANGIIIDQVGLGSAAGAYGEGTRLAQLTTDVDRGYERNASATRGFADSDNNSADFHLQTPSNPQNSSTTCLTVGVTPPPVVRVPHEIQGSTSVSPIALGTVVNVRGVVTARRSNGFFIQTAPGMEDADATTSEGLFVSTTGGTLAAAQVGHLVTVSGAVAELVPTGDPTSPPLTALASITSVLDEGAAALPAPYALTSADLSPAGTLDQLERLEGMRVSVASLTAVSGTDSNGAFFAVMSGQPRPFREPGVESGHAVLPCAVGPCNIPRFDGNPERLRVDSDGLEGIAAVNVSTDAVMANVVGPLDFSARAYTVLPESTLAPSGGTALFVAPDAAFDQFTVASFNMQRFASLPPAAYATQLAKASLTIRGVMKTPDIIGLQGVESLAVLSALAGRIDADASAAGEPAPQYASFLFDGSDPAHLNVAFLVKQRGSRVSIFSVDQIGALADFEHPPVALRAMVVGPSTTLAQTVTVIVNDLASLLNVDQDNNAGQAARARRQVQAEAVANYIQQLQSNDPNGAIVSLGDYNAFSFNDGYADLVGTIRGVPASPDRVAVASSDLVSPDLTNVSDFSPAAQRYSSISNGNAQALDHMLVSANLVPQFVGLARPRVNADFPEALRADANTPSRLSDRDPMVAYFSFPPDVNAPVFAAVDDQVAEATGPDGALVAYPTPTAHDNLDPSVTVTCDPAASSLFALGSTAVNCSTHDLAGNAASVSFSVTVHDTTAPALTIPADITTEASSSAGRAVSFSVSATDAVTASPNVTCSAVSGTVFPIGTTSVHCSAQDEAGNLSSASFTVTVSDAIPPVLSLPPHLTVEAASTAGQSVSFVATATDAVTSSPEVACTPASGSTFPVGDTLVSCVATDAAGNSSQGSFTVTVTLPVFGRIAGIGSVVAGGARVSFMFDVSESRNLAERGWVVLQVRDGRGRPDRYLSATVTDVTLSNNAGYRPGYFPRSGVDTVVFSGVGAFNGVAGYRYEITASDQGEPGPRHDTFSLRLYAPNGELVQSTSGTLRDGNIQSVR